MASLRGSGAPGTHALEPGTNVDGRFVIRSLIGRGGWGNVYAARQVSMGRDVALKVLLDANPSPQILSRFLREARLLGRLDHPNLVRVFDAGRCADGIAFVVTELLEGCSLGSLIEMRGPLPPRDALDVAEQVANGLEAAHQAGIVHRDMKPDNVFVSKRRAIEPSDRTWVVKILDFGIAHLSEPNETATATGVVLGTPRYMSPEQARGARVDARSDLYTLGLVLFEMLAGRAPFEGTALDVMQMHMNSTPPHLADVNRALAGFVRVEALVAACLRKDPSERPQSAHAVALWLADLRDACVIAGQDIAVAGDPSALGQRVLERTPVDAPPDADTMADSIPAGAISVDGKLADVARLVYEGVALLDGFASTTLVEDWLVAEGRADALALLDDALELLGDQRILVAPMTLDGAWTSQPRRPDWLDAMRTTEGATGRFARAAELLETLPRTIATCTLAAMRWREAGESERALGAELDGAERALEAHDIDAADTLLGRAQSTYESLPSGPIEAIEARHRHLRGSLACRRGEFARARADFEALVTGSEEESTGAWRASGLVGLGDVAEAAGEWDAARAHYADAAKAWSRLGRPSQEAHVWLRLGRMHERRQQFDEALRCAETAGRIGDAKVRALASTARATSEMLQGHLATARRRIEDAAAEPVLSADPLAWGRVLYDLGNVAALQRDWDFARITYERAFAQLAGAGHRRGAAAALANLAMCHAELEDLATARELLDQAARARRDIGDSRGLVQIALHRSELERRAGNASLALVNAREAIAGASALGDRGSRAVGHNNAGEALLAMGLHVEAESEYTQAVTLSREAGLHAIGLVSGLRGLARVYRARGDLERALVLEAEARTEDAACRTDFTSR